MNTTTQCSQCNRPIEPDELVYCYKCGKAHHEQCFCDNGFCCTGKCRSTIYISNSGREPVDCNHCHDTDSEDSGHACSADSTHNLDTGSNKVRSADSNHGSETDSRLDCHIKITNSDRTLNEAALPHVKGIVSDKSDTTGTTKGNDSSMITQIVAMLLSFIVFIGVTVLLARIQ